MNSSSSSSTGIGACGLAFVAMLIIKLLDYAPEYLTWFWVFAPLWMPLALVLGVIVSGFLIWGFYNAIYVGIRGLYRTYTSKRKLRELVNATTPNDEDIKVRLK